MPTYANRPDGNQSEIKLALITAGWSVIETNIMRGKMLDLLVAKHGVTIAVECKMPGKKLTPSEAKFFDDWPGLKVLVYSGQDAVDTCGKLLDYWRK